MRGYGLIGTRDAQLSMLFFAVALAIGGAGAAYPLLEMSVEILGIALLCYFAMAIRNEPLQPEARFPLIFAGAILLLPLLQLIPLPPALWHLLPGREREIGVLALLGKSGQWMPLSLDPEATRRSMLALVPGLAMFVAVIHLSSGDRLRIAGMLVGFAAFGAVLGAAQAASGGGFSPFTSVHKGHALGLFTNRNHQAIFLLIAMLTAAALGRRPSVAQPVRLVALAGLLLFAAAVIATKSRTGSVLLLAVLPSAIILLFRLRLRWRTVAIGAAAMTGLLLVVAISPVGEALIARFGFAGDDRLSFWANAIAAIRAYGPLGSGFGSFPLVYQSVEPLGSMTGSYVNHAHNDYLELALEGGVPAIIILVAGLVLMAVRARLLLMAAPRSGLGIAALGAVLIILLHSLVDYPLRMLSLGALFGFVCAIMLVPSEAAE